MGVAITVNIKELEIANKCPKCGAWMRLALAPADSDEIIRYVCPKKHAERAT